MRRITGTLRGDRYTILIISRPFLVRMRNVSDKCCSENQNTHFMFKNIFFLENHAVHTKTWKYIVERGRPQMTIWRMRIAGCIPNATKTPSEYMILIASLLEQSLYERALMLRDKYTACFVITAVTQLDGSADSWVSVCSACEQMVINSTLLTAATLCVAFCMRK